MAIARHSVAVATALLGAPIGGLALALRPAWRAGIGERLGGVPDQPGGSIWYHGASVGESRLVGRLGMAGTERGWRAFATAQTGTGLDVLRAANPSLPAALAPVDHPWCVARALARVDPAVLVLVETELWPAWIAAATRRGVPVGVVSGRISERAFSRYRRIGRFFRPTLARLARVGARTAQDAERFIALGADPARVRVTGDLKWSLGADPRGDLRASDEALVRVLQDRAVFVAGSTHEGEEEAALAALEVAESAGRSPTLVVAPRHPGRAPDVEARLRAAGRVVRRRSRLGASPSPLATGEVLLLDSLGELRDVYALSRYAFVGGSFVPIGGHDPLEAVRAGCPLAVGPHVENVRDTVSVLVDAGLAAVVQSPRALGEGLVAALSDPPERAAALRELASLEARGRAILTTTLDLVAELLEARRR